MGAYTGGNVKSTGFLAILTLYFFSMGFSLVTPGMAKFAEAFPDREYALINSLPTLFIGLAGLMLGPLAGRRMKFRTLAVLGSTLAMVAGVGPAFTSDFAAILVCRMVFGFGLGLLIPMANALVNGNYEGDRRAGLLGLGSLVFNAGGIIIQFIGGLLADMGWQMTFYGYFLYAAAIAMSPFIPEARIAEAGTGGPLDRRIWAIVVLFAVYGMMQFSVMQNTAELFEARDAGGATVAGLVLSLFTVAGCIGGMSFGILRHRFPRAVFPLLWTLSCSGLALVAAFETGTVMTAGMFLSGIGFGLIIPSLIDWTGSICTAAMLSVGTAVVTSSMYFGNFLSIAWKQVLDALFGEYMVSNIWIFVVFSAVMAVFFVLYNPYGAGRGPE